MNIGVSTYSFQKLIGSNVMTQFDTISKSKEIGFDVIEFAELFPQEGMSKKEYAKVLKEECKRVDIKMGNYTIGADFLYGSDGNLQHEVKRLCQEIELANILGAGGVRHDVCYGLKSDFQVARGFSSALPIMINGCKQVTQFAADLGIKTMVENHGFFCQDSERIERLIDGVNNINFGALIDMGNFCCVDENPTSAFGRLIQYAFHIHAKDFHFKSGDGANPGDYWFKSRAGNYLRGAIIGHGNVPIVQCLSIAKSANYNGTISIEFEGIEDTINAITIGRNNLLRYIEQS